jgi:hypothetical protein
VGYGSWELRRTDISFDAIRERYGALGKRNTTLVYALLRLILTLTLGGANALTTSVVWSNPRVTLDCGGYIMEKWVLEGNTKMNQQTI